MRSEVDLNNQVMMYKLMLETVEQDYGRAKPDDREHLLFQKERIQTKLLVLSWVLDKSSAPSLQEFG